MVRWLGGAMVLAGWLDAPMRAASASAQAATATTTLTPPAGRIVIEAEGLPPPAPVFFSATIDQIIRLSGADATGEATVTVRIVQGRPEVISLGVVGDGEIVSVTGAGLQEWAVRQAVPGVAQRFLDLKLAPSPATNPTPAGFSFVVKTRRAALGIPGKFTPLLITGGNAVGLEWRGRLEPDAAVQISVGTAQGLVAVDSGQKGGRTLEFVSRGNPTLELQLDRRGAALPDAELTNVQIAGRVNESARSVTFRLRGVARVEKAGARMPLLAGSAGVSALASGDGWHTRVAQGGPEAGYEVVFEKKGQIPLAIEFIAAIRDDGDWRRLDFRLTGGAVVALSLTGLPEAVEFDAAAPVSLARTGAEWQGFLPADGSAHVGWKPTRDKSDGALFFTTAERSEVRVGAGLLRQSSHLGFHILQGKLDAVKLRVDGPGEIVGVEATNLVSWRVVPAEGARFIEIQLSRPYETEGGTITVQSQAVLEAFPVEVEPLRLTPEQAVHHTGFVRVANVGAVRLDLANVEGMLQLAPAQFPGDAVESGARQVFAYRFPSAKRQYRIQASHILPEVSVSEVLQYTLSDTDRVIEAEMELDVREAPLREWIVHVPADHAVAAVQGAEVSDYSLESPAPDGTRVLRITFGRAVTGRQLLRLRLEKNQPAAAGEWRLPPVRLPNAKAVRGHVGVISMPGYRIVPASVERLVEMPLSLFPRQVSGLQQAFRLREADWAAAFRIEALGQSVQADVFHLYTLKQGATYASVLLNYFVVGAPASEWRVELPADAGNIDVTGQGVRREWRREGNVLIVTLHQPVLGASTLLVTFEQPLSARGGTVAPGGVRPLGVQAERGYVQLVSPLQVKTAIQKREGGLLELQPAELPAELRLFTTAPSLAVYQYTARPFAIEVGVQWRQPGETVDQVVDFAQLNSAVARDGQVVTEARLFVKSHGGKPLRLQLPAGAKLWETRVDDAPVTARADGDWVVVPLTGRLNPNEPVTVMLRIGQAPRGSGRRLTLAAPRLAVPMVVGEWTVKSEAERVLTRRGGTLQVVRPNLVQRGFEWIGSGSREAVIALVLLVGLAALTLRSRRLLAALTGVASSLAAIALSLLLLVVAAENQRGNSDEITFASTVVPANADVNVELSNLPLWQAMISPFGFALLVAGAAGLVFASRLGGGQTVRIQVVRGAAVACIAAGFLVQHGGALLFLPGLAVAIGWWLLVPGFSAVRAARREGDGPAGGAAATTAVSVIALSSALALGVVPHPASAQPVPTVVVSDGSVQSLVQRWDVRQNRLRGEIEVSVRGAPGDNFLLLKAPAVLTDFTGDGLRVSKVAEGDRVNYWVAVERAGVTTARAKFELALPPAARELPVLTGPAAVQRITAQVDQPGWDFESPRAVDVQPLVAGTSGGSGATLVLGPAGDPVVRLTPRRRNLATEATRFFAEVANLYVPAPGAVNAFAKVNIRPVQGRVSSLELHIPEGLTVGDVVNGPVGGWRFDPEKRTLRVVVEPAQAAPFALTVELQQGVGPMPFEFIARPVRVAGAAGDVGTLALAFGGEAQPEAIRPSGVSTVTIDDFDRQLLPKGADRQPLATLQSAYRYRGDAAEVALRVAPVSPEVRLHARQLLSLGDDRVVLATDAAVAITRAGVFQLSFIVPAGLEVEAVSGPALSHWTQSADDGRQVVTLHLNGRTTGQQAFAITLTGAGPAASPAWRVPQLQLREATRQTGELKIVPERGMRLRAVERRNVSELDPRSVGATQSGALAFRLLERDWALALAIETLDPWITVQALQEITMREGQTLTRLALRYRIENAAVKQVRVFLPAMTEEQARTVRATGPAVSDVIPVAGKAGLWEIRFQRGVIGETGVQIEYQGQAAADNGTQRVATPQYEGVRQVAQFVGIRGGGRLELDAPEVPRGWQRLDWSAVPQALLDRSDRSVPTLAYRVAEPEAPLDVVVRRHGLADALKLRVTNAALMTLFSPTGSSLTAVNLRIEVAEKSTLRVRLPESARLFNTLVNGESVVAVKEGDAYLFHVAALTSAAGAAEVRFVYGVTTNERDDITLRGPRLSVPLQNVQWRVVTPPGYELDSYRGSLRLRGASGGRGLGLADYESLVISKREAGARQATEFLRTANELLQSGKNQEAGEILARAANTASLDEASNEDARVQLRNLRTQQAIVGLNTRRQRMYLDNSGDVQRNEQLEQAANLNPLMKGKLEFNPLQTDQLLMGNTVEENAALRGIATRLVDQQLAADPAPAAIDVTLAERGQVLTFERSLQVEGDAPLELRLAIERMNRNHPWFGALIVAGLGAIGAGVIRRKGRV